MLADKLQDLVTTNLIMGELIRLAAGTSEIPRHVHVNHAYSSTTSTSPLRTLVRDYWVYHYPKDGPSLIKDNDYPKDFLQDVTAEMIRRELGCRKGGSPNECPDKCRYH